LNISKDERERAKLTSEYKFEVDLQSKMVDAERGGRHKQATETTLNAKGMGMDTDTIIKLTGLSRDEVNGLI
jgi:hypothetical protein